MIKKTIIISLLLITTIVAETITDDSFKEKIIGKWEIKIDKENFKLKGHYIYKEDGTLKSEATLMSSNTKLEFNLSGTWKVKEGNFTTTILKSNYPEVVPVGLSTTDKIIFINQKEFKYKTQTGSISVQTKLKQ
jgi:hypothetical protein